MRLCIYKNVKYVTVNFTSNPFKNLFLTDTHLHASLEVSFGASFQAVSKFTGMNLICYSNGSSNGTQTKTCVSKLSARDELM